MSIAVATASPAASAERPIRVMVVDDAVVARSLLRRWIDAEPDMKVVAALRTGRQAVDAIEHHDADVVMLDVDMPELDGISALPLLLKKQRGHCRYDLDPMPGRGGQKSLAASPRLPLRKKVIDLMGPYPSPGHSQADDMGRHSPPG
jgi:CheY-like chemotaxis protein